MPLVIIWMIVIFLTSAFPDMSGIYQGTWDDRPHKYIVDVRKINWDFIFSAKNPIYKIPPYHQPHVIVQKMGHVFVYSVLGWLCYRATRKVGTSFWICFAYSIFDEIHQALTPGRSARLLDIVLDVIMALLAIWLAAWFYKKGRSSLKPLTTNKEPDPPQ